MAALLLNADTEKSFIGEIQGYTGIYMEQVINNLKEKEVLYSRTVTVLKNYIQGKYPQSDAATRAQIFADAVHKILDDHVREFSRGHQKQIKQDLLLRTANKENFEINAYDIMKTCVALEIDDETFFADLTSWINHQQDVPVYRHQLREITDVVKVDLNTEVNTVSDVTEADQAEEEIQEEASDELRDTEALLAQLDAAFDYNPAQTNSHLPELFSQGDINEAFEAEMRRDAAAMGEMDPEPSGELEVDDVLWTEEVMEEAIYEPISEAEYDGSEAEELSDIMAFIDEDPESEEAPDQVQEEEPESRKVIKVEKDIEPYFSDTPEIWEVDEGPKSIMDRLKAFVKDSDMRMVALAVAALLMLVVIIVWILWYALNTNGEGEDVSAVEDMMPVVSQPIQVTREPVPEAPMGAVEATIWDEQADTAIDDLLVLDESIRYKEINREALAIWLERRGGLVGEEPYFTTIIDVAKAYDVNPLLLFAIVGQEQNFVQKDHEFAEEMINNPFNVYYSWETYNTNLEESAQIAARTIHTASEGRPEDADPVAWINETYAEDPAWSDGVNLILQQLEIEAGN